jgi:hypothetical protein
VLAENLARELCDIVPEWSRRVPLAHLLLAASVFYQGRTSEAARHLRATVESAIRLGTHTELMYTAAFASEIALRNNEPENAARLYGAFDAIRERLGFSDQRLASFNNGWSGPFVHLLRARLDADSLSDLLERGRQIPLDQLLQTIG